ncbi:histidinol-phosphate transaminase [Oxalobacter vibrioformis]|uniref:Histidinol-phosphate aminotransferase n=1 Tax=Oxalobacter vibrioformis TaxID=933080 RepID=A0A9E9LUF9_9BURK|nr:histidinol-phosphate transaminase [Oxalobacter vibrioformis]WAW09064.1 histidinol-phosphate transaminase [Oxalobacter vibrioformis]
MSLIENIIRPDVRALDAYHVPDSAGYLKLDAMENPYRLPENMQKKLGEHLAEVALNRYPVPSYTELKAKIRETLGIPPGYDVIVGNGSDELIVIVSTALARQDRRAKVLAPVPTFVMYALSAQFAGMEFVGIPLKADFSLDMDAMLDAIRVQRPSVLYLAYPNNPTGNLFDLEDMLALIEAMKDIGIVISDEAYQPFAQTSMMSYLPKYPNLVVMRTVSKLGLAGVRLGYMSASSELLAEFDKVRPPYNVNVLTEAAVTFALDHIDVFNRQAAALRGERETLSAALSALPGIEVLPSSANFVLVRLENADTVFEKLLAKKILIKNVGKMHILLDNCLRITVGTPEENKQFLELFSACLSQPV